MPGIIKYNIKKLNSGHHTYKKINDRALKLICICENVNNPTNKIGGSNKEIFDTRWFSLAQIQEFSKSKLPRDEDMISEV